MADVLRLVPRSRQEFFDKIMELYKGRSHVRLIKVDELAATIRVNLDGAAHTFGHPDMEIPLKKNMIGEAERLVSVMNQHVEAKIPPNRTDTDALFDLLEVGH